MYSRRGFTLVEMLVVIGIIGILIVALVPVVKGAQMRAKEVAVKTQCASIETALANYSQNHGGNYPGLAIDVMAPFADHALGDPDLYSDSASLAPDVGQVVNGILGGYGHYNNSSQNVFEQLKVAKDTVLAGNEDTPRFFDSLIATDAIQEYPPNPFVSTSTGERVKMRNVFRVAVNMSNFDASNNFSPNETTYSTVGYVTSLYVDRTGSATGGGITLTPDVFDNTRYFLNQIPSTLPLVSANWSPRGFSEECVFGTGETDYFSPGDFAYVPVLSASASPFGDSVATLENEFYKWGVNVSGYLLFGYGHKTHKSDEMEDEKRDFVNNGLPGMGAPGVDTIYEHAALQCFEGAIYFSKKI